MITITQNVYLLGGRCSGGVFGSNVYLLAGEHSTLVDTGFKGRAGGIVKELESIGYFPTDITNIIITHHHTDHIGSLHALKEITWAMVMAHPADADYIDGSLPQPGPSKPAFLGIIMKPFRGLWSTKPVEINTPLNDGDELPILGGTRIIHTPGHTPGSISLYIPQERLLIIGDVIANRGKLSLPSKAFTVDIAQDIQSMRKIADLEFNIACFGHGAPLTRNARPAILNLVNTLEKRYQAEA